jgi:hypothetical integral membrane protein (TIGR02206 family)
MMSYYFAKDFAGPPFVLFGTAHLVGIGIFLLCVAFLIFLRFRQNSKLNNSVRFSLATILILQEISYHLWRLHTGEWSIQIMLPLHLCSLFVWLGAFMLLTKNRFIYDFAYFIGIAGALQAFLTPDISDYGFPHYRFFHVLISHGSIMLAPLYMTIVERYRPTWKSFVKVFLWMNVYMVFVFGVNWMIGSNYMFVNHKPETASLLDILGPWPIYLLAAEGVAFVMFFLLYLPFAIGDWRWQHK